MKTVYLAGPIAGCTDEENYGWRREVKLKLRDQLRFLDPTDRDYRGYDRHTGAGLMRPEDCTKLVEDDIADIKACDIMFAYAWKTSTGTSMEYVYARKYLKIVVSVCPEQYISPWIQYHSDYVVKGLREGISVLFDLNF